MSKKCESGFGVWQLFPGVPTKMRVCPAHTVHAHARDFLSAYTAILVSVIYVRLSYSATCIDSLEQEEQCLYISRVHCSYNAPYFPIETFEIQCIVKESI